MSELPQPIMPAGFNYAFADVTGLLRNPRGRRLFGQDQEPWMADSACSRVGDNLWFPDDTGQARAAKRICQGCPVREECLEYALRTKQRWGIWGGLSQMERRKLVVRTCRTCGVEIPHGQNDPLRCPPCRAATDPKVKKAS